MLWGGDNWHYAGLSGMPIWGLPVQGLSERDGEISINTGQKRAFHWWYLAFYWFYALSLGGVLSLVENWKDSNWDEQIN